MAALLVSVSWGDRDMRAEGSERGRTGRGSRVCAEYERYFRSCIGRRGRPSLTTRVAAWNRHRALMEQKKQRKVKFSFVARLSLPPSLLPSFLSAEVGCPSPASAVGVLGSGLWGLCSGLWASGLRCHTKGETIASLAWPGPCSCSPAFASRQRVRLSSLHSCTTIP
jgi:hypothetical protein